jgi:hypothetical protein
MSMRYLPTAEDTAFIRSWFEASSILFPRTYLMWCKKDTSKFVKSKYDMMISPGLSCPLKKIKNLGTGKTFF